MDNMRLTRRNYIITALLSASFGGLVTLVITNAIPKMMKRMMAGMMENMSAQMSSSGCKPEDI
jgi:uncharacterized membrane protein YeiH